MRLFFLLNDTRCNRCGEPTNPRKADTESSFNVIGSDSLLNEYELVRIINEIFSRLNIPIVIKINNRKILAGIAEIVGAPERLTDITTAIDKIEKIGINASIKELRSKGVSRTAITKLRPILNLSGGKLAKLKSLQKILSGSETGLKGVKELLVLFRMINNQRQKCKVELDLTLARGLNYYTGAIFEVKAKSIDIGSVCGGGRYDNLTGIFGLDGVSGVGVSFGADRIYDVLDGMNQFAIIKEASKTAMIVNFGDNELDYNLNILSIVQDLGITAEIFPEAAKMKKQMAYADSKKVTYVLIAGEDEIKSNEVTVRNMVTGEQNTIKIKKLGPFFS
jgi:histidyl-tRNA synthetase